MTPEEKSLLERTYKLAEDNNAILRSMRRTSRYALIARIAYWGIILLLSFGAFYFIQPYITSLLGVSGQSDSPQGIMNSLNQAQDAANQLKDLYK